MKSFLLACAMLLATLVAPAFADTITFTNTGIISGDISTGGPVVSTATDLTIDGMLIIPGPFGTLSFDMGTFTGSFTTGGTFTDGNLALDPILFSTTPVTGTWTQLSDGTYELVGTFAGVLDGVSYSGITTQFFALNGGDNDSGKFNYHHRDDNQYCATLTDLCGTTTITTAAVPEPSTLTFFGTGLIAAAGAVRRKLQAARQA